VEKREEARERLKQDMKLHCPRCDKGGKEGRGA